MNFSIKIIPQNKIISAPKNSILFDALVENDILISADCGKKGKCGKCKVKLIKGRVGYETPTKNGDILSCRAKVIEDIEIIVPAIGNNSINVVETQKTCSITAADVVLDIGTTTIVACLIDPESGELFKKATCLNGQRIYGSDVLSRITACSEGNLKALNDIVLNQTNQLLEALSQNGKISVNRLVVAGNTTMLHIFLGEDPTLMGSYPFTPKFTHTVYLKGDDVGVSAKDVILLPSVSAYIGADIVAGILACDMQNTNKTNLLVDVGTNGEMVLSVGDKLYAAATAAGPALEGASMECGMGGEVGAVNKVFMLNGELEFNVIGKAKPIGICGSGYIDLLAVLLDEGIIDAMGNFENSSNSPLCRRVKNDCFYLTEEVYLSRRDISEFQLAKSAIYSGIMVLLNGCNITEEKIKKLYLAGGMGCHINPVSAAKVGLIPKGICAKVKPLENTAIIGAKMCALDENTICQAAEVSKRVKVIELAFSEDFQKEYLSNMVLGGE